MSVQSKLAGASALSIIALALLIREKGQKAANVAFQTDSQYTPQKKGQNKKIAINKVYLLMFL